MRRAAVVVLLAWSLAALAPAADADDADPADLLYEVRLPDPSGNHLRVAVVIPVAATGETLALRFPLPAAPTNVRNATWAQDQLVVDPAPGPRRVEFDVLAEARAVGFALVHLGRAIPVPTNVSFGPADAEVVYLAPEGWTAVGPSGLDGLAVFGRDLRTETRELGAASVTIVASTPVPAADWAYLAGGVPHLGAQEIDSPQEILILRGPGEALPEPIAAAPALAIAAGAPLDELARGLVRMHQQYRVVEVVPASAAWFREGHERYHALTSQVAANLTTPEEAEEQIQRAGSVADRDLTLPQAPAGSVTARQKGLVVVRALDAQLREVSEGRVGLADLLIELERTAGPDERYDSAEIEEAASRVAGASLEPFFAAYVYGPEWPTAVPIARAADIFLDGLRSQPDRAIPGQQVVAVFDAVNRGTAPGAVELVVSLDGESVGSTRVELGVGGRAEVGTPVVAIVPGDHNVQVGHLATTFRVIEGASLRLDRATTTPAEPAVGEPFTLLVYVANDGEGPATASLEVRENALLLQRTTNATVEGGATRAITIPMRLNEAGLHALEVELLSGAGAGLLSHEVHVTGDAPLGRGSPGPSAAVALVVIAALALVHRRARH